MTCKSCGKENENGASICASCGEELEEVTETKEEQEESSSGKKFFSKRNLILAAIGVAVVLILVLVVALLLRNPAEKAVDKLYESVLRYDYEAVVGSLPPAVVDSMKEKLALDQSELEIIDSKELTPVYIAEIDEAYQKKFATSKGYIEDAAIVYIEAKWKGEILTRDRISVYMVKIAGEWYFDPLTTFDSFPMEELTGEITN